jgi:hypothetical protein
VAQTGCVDGAGRPAACAGSGTTSVAASVGVAMGRGGSDLAMETSDVVLVRNDLTALLKAFALAQRAERIMKADLVFAATDHRARRLGHPRHLAAAAGCRLHPQMRLSRRKGNLPRLVAPRRCHLELRVNDVRKGIRLRNGTDQSVEP